MTEPNGKKLGFGYYVIGGLSFIPLIGVVFGIISIVIGLGRRKSGGTVLAILGAVGIGVTILLYGSLFYFGFVKRGGVYDDLRAQLSQTMLNSLVPSVEFYKLQYGEYPDTLERLQDSLKDSATFSGIYDPSITTKPPQLFYYKLAGPDSYYLRGVGPDGIAFTADDIVPTIDIPAGSRIGLLLNK